MNIIRNIIKSFLAFTLPIIGLCFSFFWIGLLGKILFICTRFGYNLIKF